GEQGGALHRQCLGQCGQRPGDIGAAGGILALLLGHRRGARDRTVQQRDQIGAIEVVDARRGRGVLLGAAQPDRPAPAQRRRATGSEQQARGGHQQSASRRPQGGGTGAGERGHRMILAPWPARGGDHGARPLSWCQCVRARRAVVPGTHTQEEVCAMSTADSHAALHEAATRVLAEHDLVLEELVVRRESGTTRARLVVDLPEERTGSADLDTVAEASSALSTLTDADDSLLGPALRGERTGSADLAPVAEASPALSPLPEADAGRLGPGPPVLAPTPPGVERKLTEARHFRRARGRLVILRTRDGVEHRARIL